MCNFLVYQSYQKLKPAAFRLTISYYQSVLVLVNVLVNVNVNVLVSEYGDFINIQFFVIYHSE